jgi:MoaA/NifB/PqqE/SkfB family radical SAM enzyme
MAEMTVARLERLAHDAFPSATAVGLVGRGEPLATSNRLWRALVDVVREHRILLTMVTNGTLIPRRVTPELLPFIETLNVSVTARRRRRSPAIAEERDWTACSTRPADFTSSASAAG